MLILTIAHQFCEQLLFFKILLALFGKLVGESLLVFSNVEMVRKENSKPFDPIYASILFFSSLVIT